MRAPHGGIETGNQAGKTHLHGGLCKCLSRIAADGDVFTEPLKEVRASPKGDLRPKGSRQTLT